MSDLRKRAKSKVSKKSERVEDQPGYAAGWIQGYESGKRVGLLEAAQALNRIIPSAPKPKPQIRHELSEVG
jgi:hypothetical protein